jgi:putative FmdB family regulatory protein
MPLREFACEACGHRFEELVGPDDSAACPKCSGRKLRRLLSTFAVSAAASTPRSASSDSPAPCGSCGDPRGPGACEWD